MSDQPTPSRATNELIQYATQVAQGDIPADSYQPILAQRIEQSALNRQHFEERAQLRGEDFVATHGDAINEVLDHMEAYERGLLRQADFFEDGDPESLLEGNQLLADAIVKLLEALDHYGAVYLDYGPSDYPLMNNVLIILKHLAEGTGDPQSLFDVVNKGVDYHSKAIAEIDQSEHSKKEAYLAKRKAFEDIIRALKELKPVDDIKKIDATVRPLQLALEAITHADEKIFSERFSLKPTNMPAANVLINATLGYLNEEYELEHVQDALTWYRTFTEQIEDQFDLAVEAETNSLVILEELPRTRQIIDRHDDLLERLQASLQDFHREDVESALAELTEIVEQLEASAEIFLEAAEREGKLVCLQCGQQNPPANRVCESCAAKLPQLVDPTIFTQSTFELEERTGLEDPEEDDYHLGLKTYRLFEAAYNFFEGHIEEDEFRKEIELSRKSVEFSDEGIADLTTREINEKQKAMMTPEQLQTFQDSQEMFLETKELLEEGMDEWCEGLGYFEQFIETRHRPTLETGIQIIFIASQKIHKVHKLGEIADKTLKELEDQERQEATAPTPKPDSAPEGDDQQETSELLNLEDGKV